MTDIVDILQRYSDNGESTLGLLLRGGVFNCYTLEDEARVVKVAGETRIPAGRYPLKLRQELTPLTQKYRNRFPWFEWHVEIADVRGFTNVYIHVGNKDDDTDACVLLGDTANNNRVNTGFIGESVPAYERWYKDTLAHLKHGGRAWLQVLDEFQLLRAVDANWKGAA